MRAPFEPRVSPEVVCAVSVFSAGMIIVELARVLLHQASIAASVVAVILLALWISRARQVGVVVRRCLMGGAVVGAAVFAIDALILVRGGCYGCTCRECGGTEISAGAVLGLFFGVLCLYPCVELVRALRHHAHAQRDVQLVNTCAWLVLVLWPWNSAIILSDTPKLGESITLDPPWRVDTANAWLGEKLWLHVPGVVTILALLVGIFAASRWAFRRRWLRRVFAGKVAGLRIDRIPDPTRSSGFQLSPVAELLTPWSDSYAVVQDLPQALAYRSSAQRAPVVRLVPDDGPCKP
jgi:hypothetical protein